jgi:hypothetical protein
MHLLLQPSMWQVDWPQVGGGGSKDLELTEEELFQKMVAWDQQNYIVGAGTSGTSDKNSTDGLVDNHAYSVIESRSNVCGTGIDLLKVRNPVSHLSSQARSSYLSISLYTTSRPAHLSLVSFFLSSLSFEIFSGVEGKSRTVRNIDVMFVFATEADRTNAYLQRRTKFLIFILYGRQVTSTTTDRVGTNTLRSKSFLILLSQMMVFSGSHVTNSFNITKPSTFQRVT